MKNQYEKHPGLLANQQMPPKHIAIVMDGNGRWAKKRGLSRTQGHRRGAETAWKIVQACIDHNVSHLSLFAFGQENWKRPTQEVRNLFRIFFLVLKRDIAKLHKKNVKLNVIGDRQALAKPLRDAIESGEKLTQNNTALVLNMAVNFSGRWDILTAINHLFRHRQETGNLNPIEEQDLAPYLSFYQQPEPDLLIRTSGVQRISNFMLWDLAYSEIYFTQTLWPEFNEDEFKRALAFYMGCERRFGLTSEQVALCSNIES